MCIDHLEIIQSYASDYMNESGISLERLAKVASNLSDLFYNNKENELKCYEGDETKIAFIIKYFPSSYHSSYHLLKDLFRQETYDSFFKINFTPEIKINKINPIFWGCGPLTDLLAFVDSATDHGFISKVTRACVYDKHTDWFEFGRKYANFCVDFLNKKETESGFKENLNLICKNTDFVEKVDIIPKNEFNILFCQHSLSDPLNNGNRDKLVDDILRTVSSLSLPAYWIISDIASDDKLISKISDVTSSLIGNSLTVTEIFSRTQRSINHWMQYRDEFKISGLNFMKYTHQQLVYKITRSE